MDKIIARLRLEIKRIEEINKAKGSLDKKVISYQEAYIAGILHAIHVIEELKSN